ncbi:MAG: hypothetical protein Q8S33_01120 [Myxococcales bacterium]|nr:hypothetical protein [Myxococcales bacterium]
MRLRDLAFVAASLAACGEMPSMMDAGSTGGGIAATGGGSAAGGSAAGGSAAGGSAAGGSAAGGSAAGGSAAGGSAAGGSAAGGSAAGGSAAGGSAAGGAAGGGSAAGGSAAGGSAGGGSATVSFATEVAPILRAKCQQACHAGQYQSAGSAYTRLRGMTSGGACGNQPRLVVNDGASSLVIRKILGTQTCGGKMPQGCTGNACVSATDADTIKRWIDQGALNN